MKTINKKDLDVLLRILGRNLVLNLYANNKFDLTSKLLLYAMDYKGGK